MKEMLNGLFYDQDTNTTYVIAQCNQDWSANSLLSARRLRNEWKWANVKQIVVALEDGTTLLETEDREKAISAIVDNFPKCLLVTAYDEEHRYIYEEPQRMTLYSIKR